jgi:hypothetical protein
VIPGNQRNVVVIGRNQKCTTELRAKTLDAYELGLGLFIHQVKAGQAT